MLLEAYDLEWKSFELRRQRLQKMRQQLLLTEKMEKEELRYKSRLRRLKRQEQERQAREQIEREQAEAVRREREKEASLCRMREQEKAERRKKKKLLAVSDPQMEEGCMPNKKKTKTIKLRETNSTDLSDKVQKTRTAQSKRIKPIHLPTMQPKDDDLDLTKQNEFEGDESPSPALPDDGLLDMLSLDKASDSDDESPSTVSLILPVQHDSPKRAQPSPLKKQKVAPQKRLLRRPREPSMDFDFTNAEARRHAKVVEAAKQGADEERDEEDTEPEPMPTPKKHLRRRKDFKSNEVADLVEKTSMPGVTVASGTKSTAHSTGVNARPNAASDKCTRKNTVRNNGSKNLLAQTKTSVDEVKDRGARSSSRKINGKSETLSIKERLANAELLSRISKMQEMSTPKVMDKKSKKTEKQELPKTAAAKRTNFRKVLASGPAESDVYRRDQVIENGDLNISLNSSGLMSDNDSPENVLAPSRKRPQGAGEGDVTPTKKLQFQEITKRLVKSPMPRYLRTPTPLMSPVVPSGLIKPKVVSPGPRYANVRDPITTRRLNSAPIQLRKTTNADGFGIPAGSAKTAVNGSGFSMFDAFVNSGSSGSIPKLKMKHRDVSPSV